MTIELTQAALVITESRPQKERSASALIIPQGQHDIDVVKANIEIERLLNEAWDLYEQEQVEVSTCIARGNLRRSHLSDDLNREARHKAALARSIMRMLRTRGITPDIQVQGFPAHYTYRPPEECACGTIFDPASCPVCGPHSTDDEFSD